MPYDWQKKPLFIILDSYNGIQLCVLLDEPRIYLVDPRDPDRFGYNFIIDSDTHNELMKGHKDGITGFISK